MRGSCRKDGDDPRLGCLDTRLLRPGCMAWSGCSWGCMDIFLLSSTYLLFFYFQESDVQQEVFQKALIRLHP